MIDQLLNKLHFSEWSSLIPWLFGFSAVAFIGSIVGVGIVLTRLPEDYLNRDCTTESNASHGPIRHLARKVIVNFMGITFLLLGIVMLVTPGQGILSIFVGITLIDFPGKRRLIQRMLARPKVLAAINKLRRKANQPPLAGAKASGNQQR